MYLLLFVAAATKIMTGGAILHFSLSLKRALKIPVKTGLNWVISDPFTDIPL